MFSEVRPTLPERDLFMMTRATDIDSTQLYSFLFNAPFNYGSALFE